MLLSRRREVHGTQTGGHERSANDRDRDVGPPHDALGDAP